MSNQSIFFLSSSYGKSQELATSDKQVLVFLNERGHKVINLKLFKNPVSSQVYEQSLSLLKGKPLVIAIIKQPQVLPLTLITQAIFKNCRTFVFCQENLLTDFKSITSTFLHVYELKETQDIVNTLKLLRL